jgi:tRNA-specific 2-thiouridylase
VLFPLGQPQLARVMFPVGGYEKPEIRRLAAEAGLRIAEKPESMEICFVPDNDHRRLLRERLGDRLQEGEFRSRDGQVLGTHGGHQLFTIGQRKGLGVAFGKPMYVVGIEPERNVIVLSEDDEKSRTFAARGVNWVSTEARAGAATVKIRSMHAGSDARVEPVGGGPRPDRRSRSRSGRSRRGRRRCSTRATRCWAAAGSSSASGFGVARPASS